MAIKKKFGIIIILFWALFSCNNLNYKLINKYNMNHTATVYLLKNNKQTDSLKINSYYGKDSIINLYDNKWNIIYSERCGSGCSIKKQIILTVKNEKLIENLNIESYYREGVLGDTTFKKNFIRKTIVIKNKKQLYLKRICVRNDVEFYSRTEKLIYDQEMQIYYNKKFNYNGKKYNGIKIDSSEYIYYKNKWYDFDSKERIVYFEH